MLFRSYETQDELMRDIDFNLGIMQEAYNEAGEADEWQKAVERAKEA